MDLLFGIVSDLEKCDYLNLIVSRFFGTVVSILCDLYIEDARSRHLDCSPWLIMIFRGFGFMLFTNAISSFREECPENPSIEMSFSLIGTISVFPFTSNLASFNPSFICRPNPPAGW